MNLAIIPTEMSTREIATLLNKEHRNIRISAERLEKMGTVAVRWSTYDHNGNEYIEGFLNKTDSIILAAQNSPQVTANIVHRWEELENTNPAQPEWIANLSPQAVIAIEDMNKQIEVLADKVAEDAPKVTYMDTFIKFADGSYNLTTAAKVFGIQRKKFLSLLQAESILYRQSGTLLPSAAYEKHFEVKTGIRNEHTYSQTRILADGMVWLNKRFKFGKAEELALEAQS